MESFAEWNIQMTLFVYSQPKTVVQAHKWEETVRHIGLYTSLDPLNQCQNVFKLKCPVLLDKPDKCHDCCNSTDTTVVKWNHIRQTRSLDENLLYRGSSFMSFLTSFHCDVNVMSVVSANSRWNISRFFFARFLICSSCNFCFSERSRSSQSDHRWSFRSSFLLSCHVPSTLRTYHHHINQATSE